MNIEHIKNHKNYRGQLKFYQKIVKTAAKENSSDIAGFDEILGSLGLQLYKYQKKALRDYSRDKNIYLAGGYGCGLTTTINLLSLYSIYYLGRSVICIEPGENIIVDKYERMARLLNRIEYHPPVKSRYAISRQELPVGIADYPEVLFVSARDLYNLLISDKPGDLPENLLQYLFSVGMLAIEHIEMYNPKEFIFLSNLIRILESISQTQIVVTSPHDEDYSAFRNLQSGSRSMELIHSGNLRHNVDIHYWLSPFTVNLLTDQNTFHFQRNHFFLEIKSLVGIIRSEFGEDPIRIAVWYAFEDLSERIRKDFAQFDSDLVIIDEISNVLVSGEDAFDIMIIIGMPKDYDNLGKNINGIINEDGMVFIVPPDDLLSYLLCWTRESASFFPKQQMLHLSEQNFLTSEFDLLRKKILGANTRPKKIPWGVLSDERLEIRYPSGTIELEDRNLLPHALYHGKIKNHRGNLLQATITDEGQIQMMQPAGRTAHSTAVIGSTCLRLVPQGKSTKYKGLTVSRIDASMLYSHKANILFDDHTHDAKRNTQDFDPPYEFAKEQSGVKIDTDFPDELEHMLLNFLPMIFKEPFEFLHVTKHENGVYVFPFHNNLYYFVEKVFYTDLTSTIDNLYRLAYAAIKDCPCTSGCSKCIYNVYHERTDGLRKDDFGRFLAGTLGRDELRNYENLVQFRHGEIRDLRMLTNFYNDIKARDLQIFMENLDIVINDPVPLYAVESLEPEVLGVYDGRSVKVVPLTHQHAIGVISHEYIHQWQDQVGIDKSDKFLAEGSASWLSTKVLNYYYRMDEIETDILGTAHASMAYYFCGFQFLQELESIYGYREVLNALISGAWTAEQLELRRKWEEYLPT